MVEECSCCVAGDKSRAVVRWIGNYQFVGIAREHSVVTDLKVDEGGDNAGFKPTELLLTSLGWCLATTILSLA
jgi:putative redox protein